MMVKIKIEKFDNVELYNGTFGHISNIDKSTYKVEISGEHKHPEWFHINNIKTINKMDCELITLEL